MIDDESVHDYRPEGYEMSRMRVHTMVRLLAVGVVLVCMCSPAAAFEPLTDEALWLVAGQAAVTCYEKGSKWCPEAQPVNCAGDGKFCWIVKANPVAYCKEVTAGHFFCAKTYAPQVFCQYGWKYDWNDPCVCNDSTGPRGEGGDGPGWASDVELQGTNCPVGM